MTTRKTLSICSAWANSLRPGLALLLFPLLLFPQFSSILTVQAPPPLAMKAGVETPVKLHVKLNSGYHVNSNKPADEYLIPLKLTWTPAPLSVTSIAFPEAKMEKYAFSEKPLSVYTGDFDIVTKFQAPANTPKGEKTITGKLRYQACSNTACYPPRSADVKITVNVF